MSTADKPRLYDRFTDGDRRTIAKTYKQGEIIRYAAGKGTNGPGAKACNVKFRSNVKVAVTQEYSSKFDTWSDLALDLDGAVEIEEHELEPELPVARVHRRWWRRLMGWFFDPIGQLK